MCASVCVSICYVGLMNEPVTTNWVIETTDSDGHLGLCDSDRFRWISVPIRR